LPLSFVSVSPCLTATFRSSLPHHHCSLSIRSLFSALSGEM